MYFSFALAGHRGTWLRPLHIFALLFLLLLCECTMEYMCVSGCVVECWICNREVAGLNLGLGYFAPRSTQPSIPPGSVNEYQLRLGRQRQVWLIPIVDERVGVQVKLWNPSRTRAIPERFWGDDSRSGTILSVRNFSFAFDGAFDIELAPLNKLIIIIIFTFTLYVIETCSRERAGMYRCM